MLSSATSQRYSKQDILHKISFVITDSTSHNLKVIEGVCEELEVQKALEIMLRNIQLLVSRQNQRAMSRHSKHLGK